jgi:flagella synthesis protein FlgN
MSQASVPDRAAFVGSLQAELAALQEFCQILQAEQEALLRSDATAVLKLSEAKSGQVERLAALAAVRSAYLGSQNLAPDQRGMAQWLAAQPDAEHERLSHQWHGLLEVAAQAHARNQSNGALIGVRLRHNQAALSTLHAAAQRHTLYRPDGQAELGATTRDLGRA